MTAEPEQSGEGIPAKRSAVPGLKLYRRIMARLGDMPKRAWAVAVVAVPAAWAVSNDVTDHRSSFTAQLNRSDAGFTETINEIRDLFHAQKRFASKAREHLVNGSYFQFTVSHRSYTDARNAWMRREQALKVKVDAMTQCLVTLDRDVEAAATRHVFERVPVGAAIEQQHVDEALKAADRSVRFDAQLEFDAFEDEPREQGESMCPSRYLFSAGRPQQAMFDDGSRTFRSVSETFAFMDDVLMGASRTPLADCHSSFPASLRRWRGTACGLDPVDPPSEEIRHLCTTRVNHPRDFCPLIEGNVIEALPNIRIERLELVDFYFLMGVQLLEEYRTRYVAAKCREAVRERGPIRGSFVYTPSCADLTTSPTGFRRLWERRADEFASTDVAMLGD